MVKNVFSQRGRISPTSLNKMPIVSAKQKRYGSESLREWPQIINIKGQKILNPCCKPFLKYSQMFIGVESTVQPLYPLSFFLLVSSYMHSKSF